MKTCIAMMLAAFSLAGFASAALAGQTSDGPQPAKDATVIAVDSQALMSNKSGKIGMLEVTCYSDGTAQFAVSLKRSIKLKSGQILAITPPDRSVNAIQYSATDEDDLVQNFSGWSSVGCGAPGANFELISESQHQGHRISGLVAYSVEQSKTVTAYYGAYLGNSSGRIGYLNETCYSDGTANISVYLDGSGIYLRTGQILTLTPALKHLYVVYRKAFSNQYVQTFSGWSRIGCVKPTQKLNLDVVSAPPPPRRWTEKAKVYWF